MFLNSIYSDTKCKKISKRVGRGIGSTLGKTCGTGHKGQKSRSGGFHKIGYEGGQMPLQRRLPKFGFYSHKSPMETTLTIKEIYQLNESYITLDLLKQKKLIKKNISLVKVVDSKYVIKKEIRFDKNFKISKSLAQVCTISEVM